MSGRPLVVTSDETVLEEILRVAAVVGCEIERAPDLSAAEALWMRAQLVFIGPDVLETCSSLPRRHSILLINIGAVDTELERRARSVGVEKVIAIPEHEAVLITALAEAADGPETEGGCVLGVIGGRGGAGASVLAAGIGLSAASTGNALLVDCDPLGGGIDLLLGAELEHGPRWGEIQVESGPLSVAALRSALPSYGAWNRRLSFLSCDRAGSGPSSRAIATVLAAGRRAGNVVICDLPRHLTPAAEAVVAQADLVVVVVPAEIRAAVAAKCVLTQLARFTTGLGVVVRGPAPDGLDATAIATFAGVPLISAMAPERNLSKNLERGELVSRSRGPLATTAQAVLAAVQGEARRVVPTNVLGSR